MSSSSRRSPVAGQRWSGVAITDIERDRHSIRARPRPDHHQQAPLDHRTPPRSELDDTASAAVRKAQLTPGRGPMLVSGSRRRAPPPHRDAVRDRRRASPAPLIMPGIEVLDCSMERWRVALDPGHPRVRRSTVPVRKGASLAVPRFGSIPTPTGGTGSGSTGGECSGFGRCPMIGGGFGAGDAGWGGRGGGGRGGLVSRGLGVGVTRFLVLGLYPI
jgi:hypothetical protein